ncbi:MAG: S8/S53 family peptidase [Weeksellaceae bacterium]|nr:S8/S53 family peptidase [Weeksellaceae bacterium]
MKYFLLCAVLCMTQITAQEYSKSELSKYNQSVQKADYLNADSAFEKFARNNTQSSHLRNSIVGMLYNSFPMIIDLHIPGPIASTNTDRLHNGDVDGVLHRGSGIMLYQWDSGQVLSDHIEIAGRVINAPNQNPGISSHATSVAGAMMASGLQENAKGSAPEAMITAYDFNAVFNELSALALANSNTLITNHSYGYQAGWRSGNYGQGQGWYWFGIPEMGENESFFHGAYTHIDSLYDAAAYYAPQLMVIKSIGNDRNLGPTEAVDHWAYTMEGAWIATNTPRPRNCGQTGYDCIPYSSTGKNILTVGAHDRLNTADGRYTQPGDVVMTSFTSFGPTDDGRIKPDLVAQGNQMNLIASATNDTYIVGLGTSVSTPVVTGIAGLLLQVYNHHFPDGEVLRSDMLKALLINHTQEVGSAPGPDYQAGFGLVDAFAPAITIADAAQNEAIFKTGSISQGETVSYAAQRVGNAPIKATLVWIDPPAVRQEMELNDTTPKLVNDLDLRIEEVGGTTYFPWKLDPSNPSLPATVGDNVLDNVEKIEINATAANEYNITITHKGQLQADQRYALVVSGLKLQTQNTADEQIVEKDEVQLYPNPAKESFFIRLNADHGGQYSLLSADGRVISKAKLQDGENQINIAHLPTGVYYVLIQAEGYSAPVKKLLVK